MFGWLEKIYKQFYVVVNDGEVMLKIQSLEMGVTEIVLVIVIK